MDAISFGLPDVILNAARVRRCFDTLSRVKMSEKYLPPIWVAACPKERICLAGSNSFIKQL